jgi:predicted alpha/beta hydrolase family esterase
MKNAIILHGMGSKEEYYSLEYPSASNFHWFPWLQKNLLVHDIYAITPEMPYNFEPDYGVWCREFERYDITQDTILVGHSCGGGFLLRWLSEHSEIKVNKLILVAPWLDPEREDTTDFFDFSLDGNLSERVGNIVLFQSDNEHVSGVKQSIEIILEQIPGIRTIDMSGMGHFCLGDMKTEKFPELLEVII